MMTMLLDVHWVAVAWNKENAENQKKTIIFDAKQTDAEIEGLTALNLIGPQSSAVRLQARTLLLLWDIRGKRSKAGGREVGGWQLDTESMQIRPPDSMARVECFHPETRFQKSVFTGSIWTTGQNEASPCGRVPRRETVCSICNSFSNLWT